MHSPKERGKEPSRLRCRKSLRVQGFWICICWEGAGLGVAPRAYCSIRPEGGRSSFYNPSKASCRSSGAQVRRNLGTSHTPTGQWEGDGNTQGGGWLGAHSPEACCRALPQAAFSGHTCDPQDLVQEGHTGSCRKDKNPQEVSWQPRDPWGPSAYFSA